MLAWPYHKHSLHYENNYKPTNQTQFHKTAVANRNSFLNILKRKKQSLIHRICDGILAYLLRFYPFRFPNQQFLNRFSLSPWKPDHVFSSNRSSVYQLNQALYRVFVLQRDDYRR
ncbi:hypothetical protein Hanom_Chr15g01342371 [Helianthus anomalus]